MDKELKGKRKVEFQSHMAKVTHHVDLEQTFKIVNGDLFISPTVKRSKVKDRLN